MFGFRFIKFDTTFYVILYKKGKIKKTGNGLSFFYYAPHASLVAIPMGSKDIPFIFHVTTSDYQTVSIQGQILYKIEDPQKLAENLNFTVDARGVYKSDDPEKLNQRLINEAQTAARTHLQNLEMREALCTAKEIEQKIMDELANSKAVHLLGVTPLSVNVLALKPTPEMSKALETATREALQQEADEAIFKRRQFAVEQEQKIKESELNTEIAVEQKKKQIAEKRMETERLEEDNKKQLREIKIAADIAIEEKRQGLIQMQCENNKKEADSKSYALRSLLEPYKAMDWKTLMAIAGNGQDAGANIAVAFRELAERAEKIGNLSLTPELLEALVQQTPRPKK